MQALSTAAAGMSAAASRLYASAQRVSATDKATEKQKDDDYVKERTEQIGAVQDFKANAVVAKTADQMAGALLDIKA
jgi:flagellar hook protein FlgE